MSEVLGTSKVRIHLAKNTCNSLTDAYIFSRRRSGIILWCPWTWKPTTLVLLSSVTTVSNWDVPSRSCDWRPIAEHRRATPGVLTFINKPIDARCCWSALPSARSILLLLNSSKRLRRTMPWNRYGWRCCLLWVCSSSLTVHGKHGTHISISNIY